MGRKIYLKFRMKIVEGDIYEFAIFKRSGIVLQYMFIFAIKLRFMQDFSPVKFAVLDLAHSLGKSAL